MSAADARDELTPGPAAPAMPPMPPSWGDDPDDWWWEQEAKELGHTALSGVRDTATKWGATISGFLGVFGTVAFIKGPDAFKDVHADWAAAFAASLVIAATVFAAPRCCSPHLRHRACLEQSTNSTAGR